MEKGLIKLFASYLTATLFAFSGRYGASIMIVTVFGVISMLMEVLGKAKKGELSRDALFNEFVRRFVTILMVVMAIGMDAAIPHFLREMGQPVVNTPFGVISCMWVTLSDIGSAFRNMGLFGVKVPTALTNVVKSLTSKAK